MDNGPFIFLAEDDLDDQELLIEAFLNLDNSISVQSVTNGKKAVSFLENLNPSQTPCLIILDYNLPELNGAEILNQLNAMEKYNGISKIVWSTSRSPVFEKICLDLGANAYVVKPNDVSGINDLAKLMLNMCVIKQDKSET